jgi:hypothetical protein
MVKNVIDASSLPYSKMHYINPDIVKIYFPFIINSLTIICLVGLLQVTILILLFILEKAFF